MGRMFARELALGESVEDVNESQKTTLLDRIRRANVAEGETFLDYVNHDSLKVLQGCKLEPGLAGATMGTSYQFLRKGYFCLDDKDSKPDALVFNQTVALRDSWAKIAKKQKKKK